jgi:hypothetical protein
MKMTCTETELKGVDLSDLDQDRGKCRSVVNTVMNFGFHKMWQIF